MQRGSRAALVAMCLFGAACEEQPVEAAPPSSGYELPSAAPNARGARAAGTEGAPVPLELQAPGGPPPGGLLVPEPELEAETDGGMPVPEPKPLNVPL